VSCSPEELLPAWFGPVPGADENRQPWILRKTWIGEREFAAQEDRTPVRFHLPTVLAPGAQASLCAIDFPPTGLSHGDQNNSRNLPLGLRESISWNAL
jgi:hypothetical protein